MADKKEGTILVIDDQEMNLTIAGMALRDKYEILKAESAEEGFEFMEKLKMDWRLWKS